jgi:perosamine synthetase
MPWWALQVGEREQALVKEVLESGFLNDGEVTTRFEGQLAALLGVQYVVAVTSGTAALFLSLVSLGVGPGDEVIVPDLTFIATANAVTLAGARPVLVDVDPRTLTMDPEAFARAISPRTKAVIPVHISGRGTDMRSVLGIAHAHGVAVVEDAAEALMSRSQGRWLGTQGTLGCLSFSPAKIISTGQGGAVLTNDDALHVRLRELKDQGRPVRGTGGNDVHRSIGYNFKLTNLQAAVGLGQLETLPDRLARMQQTYRAYDAGLQGVEHVSLFPFRLEEGESPQWVDAQSPERDALVAYLQARGADCRKYWFPLHTQAPYRQTDERFPQSTAIAPRLFWFPSALTLSEGDVMMICAWVREFVKAGGTERHPVGAAMEDHG